MKLISRSAITVALVLSVLSLTGCKEDNSKLLERIAVLEAQLTQPSNNQQSQLPWQIIEGSGEDARRTYLLDARTGESWVYIEREELGPMWVSIGFGKSVPKETAGKPHNTSQKLGFAWLTNDPIRSVIQK